MSLIRHIKVPALFALMIIGASAGSYTSASPVTEADISRQETSDTLLFHLTEELQSALVGRYNEEQAASLTEKIELILASGSSRDTVLMSDAYYLTGYYYLLGNRNSLAIERLASAVRYRELGGVTDRRYALGLSNMAVALFKTGDYERAYAIGLKALSARRSTVEADSSSLANNYLNLASICLEMNNSDLAITMAERGLEIGALYPDGVQKPVIADLYQVIGLSLYRNSEYTKSIVYCREALKLYDLYGASDSESKLLILNTISQLYRDLDQPEEAEIYFKRGLAFKGRRENQDEYLIYINYAGFLAENGRSAEGEAILEKGISYARETFGSDSREYSMMLASAAAFAHKTAGDIPRALEMYRKCFSYIEKFPRDITLKNYILTGYAGTLFDDRQYLKVIETVDEIIKTSGNESDGAGQVNRNIISFTQSDINIRVLKYRALDALAGETGNADYLRMAVETGNQIVMLYDRQRLEMSEEESRNNLSALSRDFYTGIIENYVHLYRLDNSQESLRGAFEYSERSKVAGFLASMRELNAARLSLPEELVNLDNDIRMEIGFYKELIANETAKAKPDSQRISTWESLTFSLLRSRDSLIKVFESSYPAFYSLKFKSEVTPLPGVIPVIGKNANLLSYVLLEGKLFIFVVNRRGTAVIEQDIDSSFYDSLSRFRKMLSVMPGTSSVRKPFNDFMDLAHDLYTVLLRPVEPYLKGDKIVISPDNILSYIPFETLITEEYRSSDLLYRDAPFALKSYRFSYIYSVTLSSETPRRSRSLGNDLIAFAPTYAGMEISDSLLTGNQDLRDEISNLPFAIIEAEDAVKQCGGTAFTLENATEGAFKSEAGRYDIIHLAMHTIVNDLHPAFSKMIFASGEEGPEDGFLNTYEVYNVPLNAMMVVLSSCNTGMGMFVTGEGLLSLARGFLFAGSRSVVMSMWEVEDASASTVIKSFYRNMRGGMTKSAALRSARLSFLRTADQARSHPFYWSTLVIYGDDTPLYYDRIKLYLAFLLLFVAAALLTAVVYRGPRS